MCRHIPTGFWKIYWRHIGSELYPGDMLSYFRVQFAGVPGILPAVSSRPTTGRPSIHNEPDLHSASLPPSPFAISLSLFNPPLRSLNRRWPASEDKEHNEQDKKQDKQNFRYPCRRARNPSKPKQGSNYCYDQKNYSPT